MRWRAKTLLPGTSLLTIFVCLAEKTLTMGHCAVCARPKGKKRFLLPIAHAGAGKMVVTTINDYGGFEQYETSYSL
jgi:P pilus assembly chaperone PapD